MTSFLEGFYYYVPPNGRIQPIFIKIELLQDFIPSFLFIADICVVRGRLTILMSSGWREITESWRLNNSGKFPHPI